jgi:hypothetical protein
MSQEAKEPRKSPSKHPEWRKKKKWQKKFNFPHEPKGIEAEVFTRYCASNRLQVEQRQEWAFSQLEPKELLTCRNYEMGREAVFLERFCKQELEAKQLAGSEWLETRVAAIRSAWRLTGFTTSVEGNPAWFIFPASRVMVLYPEWPEMPYAKIDRDERLRRLKELSTPTTKQKHIATLSDLLEPSNSSTGEKWVGQIAIPRSLNHFELINCFAAWLKVYFPLQGKIARKAGKNTVRLRPQGRASEKAAIVDDLNALAAFRLCLRAGLSRNRLIEKIKHPRVGKNPGAQVYSTEKQLNKPLGRILRRIQDFQQQTMGTLYDLNGQVTDAEQKQALDDSFMNFFKEIDDAAEGSPPADLANTESLPRKKSLRRNP